MSNGDIIVNQGLTHEGLPSVSVDNVFAQDRASRYGDKYVRAVEGAKSHALAQEASYFSICNPTAGTAIADGNASGFVTTTPTLLIFNNNAAGGKSLYLDALDLIVTTAAGASSTNFVAAAYLDTGNRYTSGGSAITPANVNMLSALTSGSIVHFGAITATASNAQRQIYNEIIRTVISVVGDKYKFRFGETAPSVAGMPLEGTLQVERICQLPPVVIPPQCSFMLYTWGASQGTARQHTFTGGFWER